MKNMDGWVMGSLAAVLGLVALFAASRAVDGAVEATGMGIFVWSYVFVLHLIASSKA